MKRNSILLVNIIFSLFFVIMIIFNYIYQPQISALAQLNKPLIQPANFTFSIWSVIYGWFLCWIVYSFFRNSERHQLYSATRYLLPLNFTLNACWTVAYGSNQILLSCFIIVAVLISCILLFNYTRPFKKLGWFNIGIFSVYLGWISIATIVNIFYFVNQLSPSRWTVFEQTIWTILALIIILLYALYMIIRRQDTLLPLTFIWALIGITLNGTGRLIAVSASATAIVIVMTLIFSLTNRHNLANRNN